MSTFGGPEDTGVGPDEGLALFTALDLVDPRFTGLFLPKQPKGTAGLARRLNPEAFYIACRWDYVQTPKNKLRLSLARVHHPATGRTVECRPVDWGPARRTGRVADLSPGAARALGIQTDDVVIVELEA